MFNQKDTDLYEFVGDLAEAYAKGDLLVLPAVLNTIALAIEVIFDSEDEREAVDVLRAIVDEFEEEFI